MALPAHGNPRVSVTVEKTGAPAYFSQIFGVTVGTISATATAEAYNKSGHDTPQIVLTGVRPWVNSQLQPQCKLRQAVLKASMGILSIRLMAPYKTMGSLARRLLCNEV